MKVRNRLFYSTYLRVIAIGLWFIVITAASNVRAIDLNIQAVSLGKTSGNIADVILKNTGNELISGIYGPVVVMPEEKYGPVWLEAFYYSLRPGESRHLVAKGVSMLYHQPVMPEGYKMTKNCRFFTYDQVKSHTFSIDESTTIPSYVERSDDFELTIPGTNVELKDTLNPLKKPELYAHYALNVQRLLSPSQKTLLDHNQILTPFSGDRIFERSLLLQVSSWMVFG